MFYITDKQPEAFWFITSSVYFLAEVGSTILILRSPIKISSMAFLSSSESFELLWMIESGTSNFYRLWILRVRLTSVKVLSTMQAYGSASVFVSDSFEFFFLTWFLFKNAGILFEFTRFDGLAARFIFKDPLSNGLLISSKFWRQFGTLILLNLTKRSITPIASKKYLHPSTFSKKDFKVLDLLDLFFMVLQI